MQKIIKLLKAKKKALKGYEVDYIIVDFKAKFKKPDRAKNKKNK